MKVQTAAPPAPVRPRLDLEHDSLDTLALFFEEHSPDLAPGSPVMSLQDLPAAAVDWLAIETDPDVIRDLLGTDAFRAIVVEGQRAYSLIFGDSRLFREIVFSASGRKIWDRTTVNDD